MTKEIITMIPCVNARDFPPEISEYCVDNEISTHYQNDIAFICNDGNIFSKWLKENGYVFTDNTYNKIAIVAT